MEKSLNNKDILKYGNFNKNQVFFIQRWSEMLNIHTHSKYAVRYLNSHQALKELHYVCKGMIEGTIKKNDNHLKLVFKEVKRVLSSDQILKENAPSHFQILDNTLQGIPKADNIPKLYSIIFQIEYAINYIEDQYLTWIIEKLQQVLLSDDENFEMIDNILQTLASELLGNGWSLQALYSVVHEGIFKNNLTVQGKFNEILNRFNTSSEPYIFLFTFKGDISKEIISLLEKLNVEFITGEEIIETYKDYKLDKHISVDKIYVRVILESYDVYTGVNNAWQKVVGSIEVLNFYGYNIPDFDIAPIILLPQTPKYIRNVKVDLLAKRKKFRAPITMMNRVIMQLKNGDVEVNRKLKSLYEFTRISDESLSPQSTFINLWIGIESFAQSKEFDGGIESVKTVIAYTSTHNYLYSIIRNFLEDCNRCKIEIKYDGQLIRIGRLQAQEALDYFWDEKFVEEMKKTCTELNSLLFYRFIEFISILKDGKKCADLLEKHKINIQQHVHRLYRIRNSIVHSGELLYNTNLFIKHLYEYIEQVMSVVINRLELVSNITLEQIFAQVRDSVDATIETLKNSRLLEKDTYINLVLRGAF